MIIADISEFQGIIDYNKLISKVDGVIMRLGYTGWGSFHSQTKDNRFDINYKGLVGKTRIGVYYFTLAYDMDIAKREADFIYNVVKDKPLDYPVYLDCEPQERSVEWTRCSRADRTRNIRYIVDYLKEKGIKCGIYGSTYYLNTWLDMNKFLDCSVWVAEYGLKCHYLMPYDLWQYTSSANGSSYGCQSQYIDLSNDFYVNDFTENEIAIAKDVIEGKYGNGQARKENLYSRIQSCVNYLLKK